MLALFGKVFFIGFGGEYIQEVNLYDIPVFGGPVDCGDLPVIGLDTFLFVLHVVVLVEELFFCICLKLRLWLYSDFDFAVFLFSRYS